MVNSPLHQGKYETLVRSIEETESPFKACCNAVMQHLHRLPRKASTANVESHKLMAIPLTLYEFGDYYKATAYEGVTDMRAADLRSIY